MDSQWLVIQPRATTFTDTEQKPWPERLGGQLDEVSLESQTQWPADACTMRSSPYCGDSVLAQPVPRRDPRPELLSGLLHPSRQDLDGASACMSGSCHGTKNCCSV